MTKQALLLGVCSIAILVAGLIVTDSLFFHKHDPDCGDACAANLKQLGYCAISTDMNGWSSLWVPASQAASDWWDGSIHVVVSRRGYRVETLPIPERWPLRVVLRKIDSPAVKP